METQNNKAKKKAAYKKGLWAEIKSVLMLLFSGYRVLQLRYKTKLGEIDIIARKGDIVAFVEVKARDDFRTCVDSVTVEAKKRIENASHLWLAKQPNAQHLSLRYDIIAVVPRKKPKHFKNAFLNLF